jgi:hypothetical protein
MRGTRTWMTPKMTFEGFIQFKYARIVHDAGVHAIVSSAFKQNDFPSATLLGCGDNLLSTKRLKSDI